MAVIKKFKAVKISQNHLLGIQDLSFSEVSYILDEAKAFIKLNKSTSKKKLQGSFNLSEPLPASRTALKSIITL